MDEESLKHKKILVTGAQGFLGTRLVSRLEKDGLKVIQDPGKSDLDLRDTQDVFNYLESIKPQIIINCAVHSGGIRVLVDHAGEVFYDNIMISTNLMEGARRSGVGLYVNPISNCSYPEVNDKELKEEEWWDGPLHPSVLNLGVAKKASWAMAWSYHKQYSMNFINLIFPNMYGPGDHFEEIKSHALGALIMKMVKAKEENLAQVIIWGSGNQVREWLYIDDAVEAIVRGLALEPYIDPVNVGVGRGVSIGDLARVIQKVVGYDGELVFDASKPDGSAYRVMSAKHCQEVFGWLPPTQLSDGIQKTVDWYCQNILRK